METKQLNISKYLSIHSLLKSISSNFISLFVPLIILQQIDANILNSKIVGDALEISRILIIFAVTVGGAYFGVLGMFLGVPIIGVIKMMLDDYIE